MTYHFGFQILGSYFIILLKSCDDIQIQFFHFWHREKIGLINSHLIRLFLFTSSKEQLPEIPIFDFASLSA